jgi:hypothetical protein
VSPLSHGQEKKVFFFFCFTHYLDQVGPCMLVDP